MIEDLQIINPEALLNISVSKIKETAIDKKVAFFFVALKSMRDSWSLSQKWMEKHGYDSISKTDSTAKEKTVFATIDCVIKAAVELFGTIVEEALKKLDVHQEAGKLTGSSPVKKAPGPPAPPPPGSKNLLQRKAITKLKRSTQMLTLFRKLKDKMEGSNQSTNTRSMKIGGSSDKKEGMAASLAELTKRSPYFQQIAEDVQKYEKPILDLIVSINSFQTNNMAKLLDFRNNFESILGVLTDESQVLAKFEGFPRKKMETIRTAATLYSNLSNMLATLKTCKIEPPPVKLLDKVDSYFSKLKLELDKIERNKDEEAKKFKSFGIDFDYLIVTRIKESMVDLSSGCIELVLKERKEENRAKQMKESVKMLWRVFQLAFRVYSFAGGQDDCADKLAKQLADEILQNQ